MQIRPHHLQCIKYFIGNGYNDAFSKNMTEIIEKLKKKEPFTLVNSKDDICAHCPNLINGECKTKEKVDRYDEKIMKKLCLRIGETYIYSDIKKNLLDICADCEWHDLCKSIAKTK